MADAPKLNKRNFDVVASHIVSEYNARKGRRQQIEQEWDDIDRQVKQQAIRMNIDRRTGKIIKNKEWQSFYEVPWQALAREVLADDIMRLVFTSNGKYFQSRVDGTKREFDEAQQVFNDVMFLGAMEPDRMLVNSQFIGKMVDALLTHGQSLYKYTSEWLKVILDAITYGTYAARYKIISREKYEGEFRNVSKKVSEFPAIVHYPIRNVYLDDSLPAVLHTDEETGPAHIFLSNMRAGSLQRLIKMGSDGWVRSASKALADVKTDEVVQLIEMEGDFIVPRSVDPIYLPSVCITVAVCPGNQQIVRYQELDISRSWLTGTYFPSTGMVDGKILPYGISPLSMGRSIQAGGTCAFNRAVHAAILNAEPPFGYDRNDPTFAADKPALIPGAAVPTDARIQPYEIGNVAALVSAYQTFKTDYSDATGISATRVGEETKSHTTAYAVNQTLDRAVTRTVEFAKRFQLGTLQTALNLEYAGWKKLLGKSRTPISVYSQDFRAFVPVTSKMLPENTYFEVYGVAEQQAELEEQQQDLQTLDFAAKLEQLVAQTSQGQQQPTARVQWGVVQTDLIRERFGSDGTKYIQSPASVPSGVPAMPAANPGVPGPYPGTNPVAPPTDSQLAAIAR